MNSLLEKLNAAGLKVSVRDIASQSFRTFRGLTKDSLSYTESKTLHAAARKTLKDNKIMESRLFARANPQLRNAPHLGIKQHPIQRDYNGDFGGRADNYARPGSVASMFSPAAYLTEMYREAKNFHSADNPGFLDTRRPDLASLMLSQKNMDEEITTLSLANEVMTAAIVARDGIAAADLPEKLSLQRYGINVPFHEYYETVRQGVLQRDPLLGAFTRAPALQDKVDLTTMLAIQADISPELRSILTDDITADGAFAKNFGNIPTTSLTSSAFFADYFELTAEQISSLVVAMSTPADTYGPVYINDQKTFFSFAPSLVSETMTRTPGHNYSSQINFIELIPLGGNGFKFKFNLSRDYAFKQKGKLDIIADGSHANTLFSQSTSTFQRNNTYSVPISLSDTEYQKLTGEGLYINIEQYDGSGKYLSAQVLFKSFTTPVEQHFLRLNKIIRLHKATGISIPDIQRIIQSDNANGDINDTVLIRLFTASYYQKRYGISIEEALILSNVEISQVSIAGQPDEFTRLFNTPPLNGKYLIPDVAGDSRIEVAPDKLKDSDYRRAILKRAWQVNDSELYLVRKMVDPKTALGIANTVTDLSDLYTVKLLADVHHLSITELYQLLQVSPYKSTSFFGISDTHLMQVVAFIYATTQWLNAQKMTVSQLFTLATTTYSAQMTPEISTLLQTLRDGMADKSDLTGDALNTALAPFISASLKIDSTQQARNLLTWTNLTKPADMTVDDFWSKAQTGKDDAGLVAFCQALAQYALIIRTFSLSPAEMNVVLAGKTAPGHDVAALMSLTRLHDWVSRCADKASETLAALTAGSLSSSALAAALQVDEVMLQQALALSPATKAAADTISDWQLMDTLMQWLDMADTLKMTPDGVAALLSVRFIATDSQDATTFAQWQSLSESMLAALDMVTQNAVVNVTNEMRSGALCSYYSGGTTSRDTLYTTFLIDNQVSSQIKTTRIAEAIASVQYYANRCLNGLETGVEPTIRQRQYFVDWDRYNKRYSTWVGVSQLAYYPENYIDPTVRIGQTKMMDTLLQSISQSSISPDTVGDAFVTYLTSFEQVANLEVVSGYHDGVDVNERVTYFIGRNSSETVDYYWRSADQSKRQDGNMAANAWTEWTKIELGMNPYENLVRPVIFNDRLNIVWVERSKIQNGTTSTRADAVASFVYNLKLSHLRYDGSWSAPLSFDVTDAVDKSRGNSDAETYIPGLYVSREFQGESDVRWVVFYKPTKDGYPEKKTGEDTGLFVFNISSDMTLQNSTLVNDPLVASYNNLREYLSPIGQNVVINQYANVYSIDPEIKQLTPKTNSDILSLSDSSALNIISSLRDNGNYDISAIIQTHLLSASKLPTDLIRNALSDANYIIPDDVVYASTSDKSHVLLFSEKYNEMFISLDVSSKGYNHEEIFFTLIFDGHKSIVLPAYNYQGKIKFKNTPGLIKEYAQYPIRLMTYFSKDDTSPTSEIYAFTPFNNKNTVQEQKVDDIKLTLRTNDKYWDWHYSDWNNNGDLIVSEGKNVYQTKVLTLEDCDRNKLDNGKGDFSIDITCLDSNGTELVSGTLEGASIQRTEASVTAITINKNLRQAQYMTVDGHNIRLNTLFAHQLVSTAAKGIESVLSWKTQLLPEPALIDGNDIPMDFGGANALYFWELFYYTPMLVASRFLQEQRFTEAEAWLQYIYDPKSYVTDDASLRYWNVRPLEEDTTWNDDPLDSVDPDAVAQNDPMHYKVSTFMHYLDMLMARGDAAYRLLDRDSLNEAKMWYIQTLTLLGDEPWDSGISWGAPTLSVAADETTQSTYQDKFSALIAGTEPPQPLTANSVLPLFFPQTNEKLHGYWQTLAQRLYNLRHNLSIDGQPLSMPIYAAAADPKALLSAAVLASEGGSDLPAAVMPLYRFPVILESSRSLVGQLTQFGTTLQGIIERQDAEALNEMLLSQGRELMLNSLKLQDQAIAEVDSDIDALNAVRDGAQQRADNYQRLYDENISAMEKRAMDMRMGAAITNATASGAYIAEGVADAVPNIFGLADGGSHWGGIPHAVGVGIQLAAEGVTIEADKISESESYRRRREEWGMLRDQALSEVKQAEAQQASLAVRRTAAVMQKDYLTLQQTQLQAQLAFQQTKFSNGALYNWLRGKLAAIYYQFYDLTVSRCRMAEKAWQWELSDSSTTFIRPGAWSGTYAGLMAGETLQLSLAQMEDAWLKKDTRALEITRTVSLADIFANLKDGNFALGEMLPKLADGSSTTAAGNDGNGLKVADGQLQVFFTLSDLNIATDYPSGLGDTRRLKQVSISLPALLGPYQDIRAVLNYGGSVVMPRGCSSVAISHGMNDSGLFQLDFNDARYLPFEGIPVNDKGTLTLSFPLDERQKPVLQSLTDIIVHLRYTIRNSTN